MLQILGAQFAAKGGKVLLDRNLKCLFDEVVDLHERRFVRLEFLHEVRPEEVGGIDDGDRGLSPGFH